jgi:hypothetical protein
MKFSNSNMLKVGVKILSQDRLFLECETCGAKWAPNLSSGGKLPARYWQCPNGCNHPRKH